MPPRRIGAIDCIFLLHIAWRTELVDKGLAVRDNRWVGVLTAHCCARLLFPFAMCHTPLSQLLAASIPARAWPPGVWVPRGEGRRAYPRLLLLSELSRNAIAAGLACGTIPHGDGLRPPAAVRRRHRKVQLNGFIERSFAMVAEKCHLPPSFGLAAHDAGGVASHNSACHGHTNYVLATHMVLGLARGG